MPEHTKAWVPVMKPTEPLVHVTDSGRNSYYQGVNSRNVFLMLFTERGGEWRIMQIIPTTVTT